MFAEQELSDVKVICMTVIFALGVLFMGFLAWVLSRTR